jgi:hypothetical protein
MGEIILALDPGLTNGLAWFREDYQLAGFDQVKLDKLPEWLATHKPVPTLIIYEDYILWKHKAQVQAGSDMPASQAVGMIKSYAAMHGGIPLVKQNSNILQTAVLMSQMPMPKDHSKSHWVSAYNHAFWYMVQHGLRQVEMEEGDK